MADLRVTRAADGSVKFVIEAGPAQVLAVAMVDEQADQVVWAFTSDAFTERLPYTVDTFESAPRSSAAERSVEQELLARGVDPTALEAVRQANRRLESFEYGLVPPGFRQMMPSGGAPAALMPGKRYCITAMGGAGELIGTVSFTA
jgi:hypothetical protein